MKTIKSKALKTTFDHQSLIDWFKANRRKLPWRGEKLDPYAVWVSEVMLQQTQVSVVIPYFKRWMENFPSVTALAKAPLDEVIKCWEGLGYYSRARNLHAGAQFITKHYHGCLPTEAEELLKIKGLGPYTVGAICSFAYHQKIPAVDGNVIRVLCRVFNLHEDIGQSKTVKQLNHLAASILPTDEHWLLNEGLIELGALICTKRPQCEKCPIRSSCKAFENSTQELLPVKKKKTQYEQLFRGVAIIRYQNQLLIKRGQAGEIMSDLHEFPYMDSSAPEISFQSLQNHFRDLFDLELHFEKELHLVKHSFTRFRAQLHPFAFQVNRLKTIQGYEWKTPEEIRSLAFSSGHRRVLKQLKGFLS